MLMQTPQTYRTYSGTIVFIIISGLKAMSSMNIFSSISLLNRVAGASGLLKQIGPKWIGTTPSGLFILVPDESGVVAHEHILALFGELNAAGIPIRCGLSSGRLLAFEDVDGGINFIGRAINIAARLAFSGDNTACLIHESYMSLMIDLMPVGSKSILNGATSVVVKGKAHDGFGFRCLALDSTVLLSKPDVAATGEVTSVSAPAHVAALILTYDLPRFSEGDDSHLSKRVRALVDVMQMFKANNSKLKNLEPFFSPGGDGGTLVLPGSPTEAFALSRDLANRLIVENERRDQQISVDARMGLHYGNVLLYRDAADRLRPTGQSCFIAEELMADEEAKRAGLVYSGDLKVEISLGSDEFLERYFKQLPSMSMYGRDIERYVSRLSPSPAYTNPLLERLFGPTSSWPNES